MYYVGIDVGGTNLAVGVINEQYQIISRSKAKTPESCDAKKMSALFGDLVLEALEKANLTLEDVPYVGVGVPAGINHDTGIIAFCANLDLRDWALQKDLSERLGGKPVLVENDANAAAFGEYKAGVLAGSKNALAITLGTGIGSGIIIDGKIYTGSNFMGGEAGHIVIEFGGRKCGCGRHGCWGTAWMLGAVCFCVRPDPDHKRIHAVGMRQGEHHVETGRRQSRSGKRADRFRCHAAGRCLRKSGRRPVHRVSRMWNCQYDQHFAAGYHLHRRRHQP